MKPLEVRMTVSEGDTIKMGVSGNDQVPLRTSEVIKAGSTDNYEDLKNLPKINNNTVIGNKNGNLLGLINSEDTLGLQEIDRMFEAVFGQ